MTDTHIHKISSMDRDSKSLLFESIQFDSPSLIRDASDQAYRISSETIDIVFRRSRTFYLFLAPLFAKLETKFPNC